MKSANKRANEKTTTIQNNNKKNEIKNEKFIKIPDKHSTPICIW